MRAAGHGHRQRGHLAVEALADLHDLFEALAGFSRRADHLVERDAAGQPALLLRVDINASADVLVRDDLADLDALFLRVAQRLGGAHAVAGMVQRNQHNAGLALEQAQRFQQLRRTRRGKNIAHHARVQHAFAHKPAERGLMSGAAQRDNRDLALVLRRGAHHNLFVHEFDLALVAQSQALQQFLGQVRRIIDKLLHRHNKTPLHHLHILDRNAAVIHERDLHRRERGDRPQHALAQ